MAHLSFAMNGKHYRQRVDTITRHFSDGRVSKPMMLPDGDELSFAFGVADRTLKWLHADTNRQRKKTRGDNKKFLIIFACGVFARNVIEALIQFAP